jgi:metal-responsive CopG/Arc/MetJ family transcriptional regulator
MATTRTTIALPDALLEGVDDAVRGGHASSRNDFLSRAVRSELERLKRLVIDHEFEAMASDSVYRSEAKRITEEYEMADWESLRIAEGLRIAEDDS